MRADESTGGVCPAIIPDGVFRLLLTMQEGAVGVTIEECGARAEDGPEFVFRLLPVSAVVDPGASPSGDAVDPFWRASE